MSHKIISASFDTECCCCGTSNIELNVFMGGVPEREHGHCEICYGTFAGNACVYPQNYSELLAERHFKELAVERAKKAERMLEQINEAIQITHRHRFETLADDVRSLISDWAFAVKGQTEIVECECGQALLSNWGGCHMCGRRR